MNPTEPNAAAEFDRLAAALEARGDAASAAELRRLVATAHESDSAFRERVAGALSVHHDINNALTGVLGNAQLLLLGPAAEVNGARKRIESLVREAERIRDLVSRMRELRGELLERNAGNGGGGQS